VWSSAIQPATMDENYEKRVPAHLRYVWRSEFDKYPYLLPGESKWIRDFFLREKLFSIRGRELEKLAKDPMVMHSYAYQRQVDLRNRHLEYLKSTYTVDTVKTAEEWAKAVIIPAGFDAEELFVTIPDRTRVKFNDVLNYFFNDYDVRPMLDPKRYNEGEARKLKLRRCYRCDKVCDSECICGETFCSRDCLILEYELHQRSCHEVRNAHLEAIIITLFEFKELRADELRAYDFDGNPEDRLRSRTYKVCGHCSIAPEVPLKCSGCGVQTYCSEDCQKLHWKKVHKHICKQLTEAKSKAATKARADDDGDGETE